MDCGGDSGAAICGGGTAEMVSLTAAHTLPIEASVSEVSL